MALHLDYTPVLEQLPLLLKGCEMTIEVSLAALAIGLVFGLIGAVSRISPYKIFSYPAFFYVWVIRGTPFMVQLFVIYFGLSSIGLSIGSFMAGIIGLAINCGAYITEIIRGGIQSVDKGQSEAARALGMSPLRTLMSIVFPQAMKHALPAMVNEFISTLKNSSIVSLVTIAELMHVADRINSTTFRSFEVYTVVAFLYLIMNTFFMILAWILNKKMVK